MIDTLTETLPFRFDEAAVARLATQVDETEPSVRKALNRAVPLLFTSLASQVGQGLTPEDLLQLVLEARHDHLLEQLADPHAPGWPERAAGLLLRVLGSASRNTANLLAVEAGIRPTASTTLLQVAAMAVLGVLGELATANAFSPTDFVYWLHARKKLLGEAMLPLAATAPGTWTLPAQHLAAPATGLTAPAPAMAPAAWAPPEAGPPTRPALRYWQWGALLVLAAFVGYFISSNRATVAPTAPRQVAAQASRAAVQPPLPLDTDLTEIPTRSPLAAPGPAAPGAVPGPPEAAPELPATPPTAAAGPATEAAPKLPAAKASVPDSEVVRADAAPVAVPARGLDAASDKALENFAYDTGQPLELTLADGSTQKVGVNSSENRLFTFLSSPAIRVDSVNRSRGWINLDRVRFKAGKAAFTPESEQQLSNIARILNNFPQAVIKIGGYTDGSGSVRNDYRLSEDRARNTLTALTKLGVSPQRIEAQGYGPNFFVASNSTPLGRALNRRISIRVMRK